jgi:hypothetical protein
MALNLDDIATRVDDGSPTLGDAQAMLAELQYLYAQPAIVQVNKDRDTAAIAASHEAILAASFAQAQKEYATASAALAIQQDLTAKAQAQADRLKAALQQAATPVDQLQKKAQVAKSLKDQLNG